MCLCDNIGLVALILLGWELRASSITVLCVQAVMILSPLLFMPSLYSHSNSKNFYITCIQGCKDGMAVCRDYRMIIMLACKQNVKHV